MQRLHLQFLAFKSTRTIRCGVCHGLYRPRLLQVALCAAEAEGTALWRQVQDLESSNAVEQARGDQRKKVHAVEMQVREALLQTAREDRASAEQQLVDTQVSHADYS